MFFSSKKRSKLILTVEIDSSHVISSLVFIEPKVIPIVFWSNQKEIEEKKTRKTAEFTDSAARIVRLSIEEALREVKMEHTRRSDFEKIDEVHFILSSPWVIPHIKTISSDFGKKTKIKSKLIHSIIDDFKKSELERHLGAVIVDDTMLDVRINGYSLANIEEKHKAESVEISYAYSLASHKALNKFAEACEGHIESKNIHYHSASMLLYLAISNLEPHFDNYALIKVHGKLTDVVEVNNRIPSLFGSYPFGIDNVIDHVALKDNTGREEARSLIKMHIDRHIDEVHAKSNIETLSEAGRLWAAKHKEIRGDRVLPLRVMISGGRHKNFFERSFGNLFSNTSILDLPQPRHGHKIIFNPQVKPGEHTHLYVIAIHDVKNNSYLL